MYFLSRGCNVWLPQCFRQAARPNESSLHSLIRRREKAVRAGKRCLATWKCVPYVIFLLSLIVSREENHERELTLSR